MSSLIYQRADSILGSQTIQPLYNSLDPHRLQVRLLQVSLWNARLRTLRQRHTQVECSLETYFLSDIKLDSLNYYALSYVWGNPKITKEIKVNGHIILVTKNLESFLQRWRALLEFTPGCDTQHPFEALHIWVDAICPSVD
jgi:hypothetical protein